MSSKDHARRPRLARPISISITGAPYPRSAGWRDASGAALDDRVAEACVGCLDPREVHAIGVLGLDRLEPPRRRRVAELAVVVHAPGPESTRSGHGQCMT